MGCISSKGVTPEEIESSFADRLRIFSDSEFVRGLLGFYEDDVKDLYSMCTVSKSVKLSAHIALVVVMSGEIFATVSPMDDKVKVKAKTFVKGDVIPFFLTPQNYTLSNDGSTFIFGNQLKLRFRFNNTKHSSTQTGGIILTLSREKLNAFLSTRERLAGLRSLVKVDGPRLIASCPELKGLPEAWTRALVPLLSLRAFEEGDLLLHWSTLSPAALAKRSRSIEAQSSGSVSVLPGLSVGVGGVVGMVGGLRQQTSDGDDKDTSITTDDTGTRDTPARTLGVLLLGSAARMHGNFDVETTLSRVRALKEASNARSPNFRMISRDFSAAGKYASSSVASDGRPLDWASEGNVTTAGSVLGIELAFLRPALSLHCAFGATNGLLGGVSPETIDAMDRLDPTLVPGWRRQFCLRTLLGFKTSIQLLSAVSEENMAFLASKAELLTLPAGACVCKAGDEAQNFYILLDGEVEQASETDKAATRILRGGEYFSDLQIVTGKPYDATLTTLCTTVLLAFRREDFLHVFSQDQKTLIEIKLRAMGGETELIYILHHAQGCGLFLKFLEGEFATENLLFWQAVEAFERGARAYQRESQRLLQSAASANATAGPTLRDHEEEKSMDRLLAKRATAASPTGKAAPGADDVPHYSVEGNDEPAPPIEKLISMAGAIISAYVTTGSMTQVNIPSNQRVAIEAAFSSWTSNCSESSKHGRRNDLDDGLALLFTTASKEVYELLRKDGFVRWKRTPDFAEFLRNLKQQKHADVKATRLQDVVSLEAFAEASRHSPCSNVALQEFKEKSFREKSTTRKPPPLSTTDSTTTLHSASTVAAGEIAEGPR